MNIDSGQEDKPPSAIKFILTRNLENKQLLIPLETLTRSHISHVVIHNKFWKIFQRKKMKKSFECRLMSLCDQLVLVCDRGSMREIFVEEAFESKTILITGGTGFIGKVLVEKLLRSCKGIEKIFILVRVKNSKSVNERFETYKSSEIFDVLRRKDPQTFDKLVPIEGDLTVSPLAGIDYKKLETIKDEVNFVFHCAALTKSNEPIETAITVNLIGTRNIINLAEKCKRLEAFVHISTAYSNLNEPKIFEEIYKPFYDYKSAIKCVESSAIDELNDFTKIALKSFPNTYLASKNLAEQLVCSRSKIIPSAIVRASNVGPTYREPLPGWGNDFSGAKGILTGTNSGFIRSIHGCAKMNADWVPCDFAVSAIITSAASVASSANKELKVYNCTSSKHQLPMTWKDFIEIGQDVYKDFPTTKAVWFPGARLRSNYAFYMVCYTLFQLLPSTFIDLVTVAIGKKAWAVKLQKKMFSSQQNFSYLLRTSCEWDNANFELLFHLITLKER